MRRLIPFVALLFALFGNSYAQVGSINRVEYYIDTDPGYGQATSVAIIQDTIVDTSLVVDLSGVSDGLHIFHIRARNDSGWSIQHSQPFLRINANPPPKIEQIEYFINTDAGFGKDSLISFTIDTLVDQTFNAAISGLQKGINLFHIRARDSLGHWSIPKTQPVLYYGEILHPKVTYVEYYIDTDPGFGNGTSIAFTPDTLVDITQTVDLTGVSEGIHTINVRAQDSI